MGNNDVEERLRSKGWTSKLCKEKSGKQRKHWLSPELGLEFRNKYQASTFQEMNKGSEEEKWDHYLKKVGGRRPGRHVVGGYNALNQTLPRKSDQLSSTMKNEDECCKCNDGGGKDNLYRIYTKV